MAGTLTVTSSRIARSGGVARYRFVWQSDAGGAVSGTSAAIGSGGIIAATFLPDSGGTAPTNLYDVTLLCDVHGVDVLNDEGLNLSDTAGSHHSVFSYNADKSAFFRQWLHGGGYTFTVANAGNAKGGTVDLYVAIGAVL